MPDKSLMNLKILLPFCVFASVSGVTGIVADTEAGSLGILPHRVDCVAALTPGILAYKNSAGSESYLAVDQGILVKTGFDVLVSVRNAIGGTDLRQLQETVEKEFMMMNEQEQNVRSVMSRMESAFLRQIAGFNHE